MRRAVSRLAIQPQLVLVDGNQSPGLTITTRTIVKGDSIIPAISAASILAKVARDKIMLDYHLQYPNFAFHCHKGYGTKQHLAELEKFGALDEHRKTFAPIRKILKSKS